MPDSLQPLQSLALKYANMQRKTAYSAQSDETAMRQHIQQTLCRCLPECVITAPVVQDCWHFLLGSKTDTDPMHTGAIHAYAGQMLLHNASDHPLMKRLHQSACRLLPQGRPATRDDLRLVTLDALYAPKRLPPGEATAFVRHRLGLLDGTPRSCAEIACFMHKPLVYIHELEAAILTTLSSYCNGGHHA